MKNLNTLALVNAANTIKNIKGKEVTGIQFEDGSGCCFNYMLKDDTTWSFIRLKCINIINKF